MLHISKKIKIQVVLAGTFRLTTKIPSDIMLFLNWNTKFLFESKFMRAAKGGDCLIFKIMFVDLKHSLVTLED